MTDKLQQAIELLTPLLAVPDWGIGGSLLLTEQGLLADFRDIDILCTETVAPDLAQLLQQQAKPLTVEPHPQYCSQYFRRFQHPAGFDIELMAGIAVRPSSTTPAPVVHWAFDPGTLQVRHGVPWMLLSDWLTLYQLFERPQRVELLQQWLKSGANLAGSV